MNQKVLKKGEKFTASSIDEGEFTYYMTLAEYDGASPSIIAFKDGSPWVIDPSEVDPIVVKKSTPVLAPPASFAFKKGKKNG